MQSVASVKIFGDVVCGFQIMMSVPLERPVRMECA